MKLFISSVRRGLEDERDALPGLIIALGHEPIRFEDFSPQNVPSREACLRGVDATDAYLLMLGAAYGDPLPDTGLSPTEEEFNAAKRRGIPVVVLRKTGVNPEPMQEEFLKRVEDYATGKFRGSFETTAELLTVVTTKIKELEAIPPALQWDRLERAPEVNWIGDEARSSGFGYGYTALLELHVLPLGDVVPLAVAELDAVAKRLARVGREADLFSAAEALDLGADGQRATVRSTESPIPDRGIQVGRYGSILIWLPLEKDTMGAILDSEDLQRRLHRMLQLADDVGLKGSAVTFAVGLGPIDWIVEGNMSDLGHRSSAAIGMSSGHARVPPEDSVPSGAVRTGGRDIAGELAVRLMHAFRLEKG